jgi:hypothetical protein
MEANQYDSDRNNEDEWGDAVIPTSNRKRRLAAVISVRFAPDELEYIRLAAPNGNLSQFIRQAALNEASRHSVPWIFPSYAINWPAPGGPPTVIAANTDLSTAETISVGANTYVS